jgi:hypothetical protein
VRESLGAQAHGELIYALFRKDFELSFGGPKVKPDVKAERSRKLKDVLVLPAASCSDCCPHFNQTLVFRALRNMHSQ